jgi:hypothetical protein
MAKTKQTKASAKSKGAGKTQKAAGQSFDGVYLFKMVFYLLLGSMWLKISNGNDISVPIPIGLLVGLVFTTHEHFQIDRKIEYAVLLVAMLFGFFASYGLYINF